MCISNFKKIFPGVIPPDPHDKGEGKERRGGEGRDGVNPRKQILATALVDGMSKSSSLTRIVNDVKGIVHVFFYKTQLLEEEGHNMVQEHLIDQIASDGEDVHV
jgi:hypothetical protein